MFSLSARTRAELRPTATLALPLIIGQLSAIGMSLVDAMLAGHFSAHVLGAVAVGASLWSLAVTAAFGVMLALPPSVAQLDGAGRREHIGHLFQQALWLALALGVLLFFGLRFGAPWLVRVIGVAPGLLADVNAFVHAVAWGAPALAFYFTLRGLPEGLSVTRPTMLIGMLGLAALIPIGYVLMYGKLGLPVLGARGSGIATAIVIWLMALAMALHVAFGRRYRDLGWPARWPAPHPASIGKLLRLGAPMGVSVLMESSLFVAVALAIGTLGEDVVAAHQVALNVAAVAFMLPLGLAMAITIRVGNAAGRGDAEGVRAAGRAGLLLVLVTQCVSSGLMLLAPHAIAGLYSSDLQVTTLAAQLLMLAGIFQFSDGIQVASNGALRGLKDTRVPMFLTAFAYWVVGMPVGGWLAIHHDLGARGWWMGLIAGLTVAAVVLTTRFQRLSQQPERWKDLPAPPPDPSEVT
ncbi:MAG TPA: MATE family efflux transporter [Rhodanobacteraceae bacterium]|nr:MATE family efflux transporter [Rhodanobacteraceae bacterium]